MKPLLNIDKSGFRRGEYVGYAHGVWRIRKDGREWVARHREEKFPGIRGTLTEISAKLETIAATKESA